MSNETVLMNFRQDVKRKLKKDLSSNARALRRLRTTRVSAKGTHASTAPPLATTTRCSRSFIPNPERAPTSTSKHDPTLALGEYSASFFNHFTNHFTRLGQPELPNDGHDGPLPSSIPNRVRPPATTSADG